MLQELELTRKLQERVLMDGRPALQCDACRKWRFVSQATRDSLGDGEPWTCQNEDVSCMDAQEEPKVLAEGAEEQMLAAATATVDEGAAYDWLPPGWTFELTVRQDGTGRKDVFIFSPDGRRFRSGPEAARAIMAKKDKAPVRLRCSLRSSGPPATATRGRAAAAAAAAAAAVSPPTLGRRARPARATVSEDGSPDRHDGMTAKQVIREHKARAEGKARMAAGGGSAADPDGRRGRQPAPAARGRGAAVGGGSRAMLPPPAAPTAEARPAGLPLVRGIA